MKRIFSIHIIGFILFSIPLWAYKYENTVRRAIPVKPDTVFKLNTVRGDVEISTYEGDKAIFEVNFQAYERSELSKALLSIESHPNEISVSSTASIAKSRLTLLFKIKIPVQVNNIEIITQNGEIVSRGMYRHLALKTGIGNIHFTGSFAGCLVNTINGDVDVEVKNLLSGNLTVDTPNGSIRVTLDEDSAFTVEGFTRTGEISSDFKFGINRGTAGTTLAGKVKGETHRVKLNTVNGDIELIKK